MSSKKEKWYNHLWVITIVGAIAGTSIGTLIYDWAKQKPIASTLWQFLLFIGHSTSVFLNFELKLWWVLATIVCLFLLLILLAYLKKPSKEIVEYTSYKKDKFAEWVWRWDWKYNINENYYDIIALRPFCPACDTELINHRLFGRDHLSCPRCLKDYREYVEGTMETEVLIKDNVRKKFFPNE